MNLLLSSMRLEGIFQESPGSESIELVQVLFLMATRVDFLLRPFKSGD
jgi:hypothetical protein